MKHILITGAYGFVGTNLAEYFAKIGDFVLTALDVKQMNNLYPFYYSWDQLDSIPWSSFDMIIHLAGKAHDTKNTSDPKSYFDINTGLTKLVFDRFMNSDAKVFVLFSSVKAVADTVKGDFLTEETLPNPMTPYGQSKRKAEEYILTYNGDDSEKKIYILRPSMIHGPGNKGNLNLLYKVVSQNIPWPLGAFSNQRSFLNIDNLCFILHELSKGKLLSGVYQVADDQALSTNDLIKVMARSMGNKPLIWKINRRMIEYVARIGDFAKLPLTSERLKKLTESYVVSNKKIKKALHIEAMPVSVEDGLKKTLDSFIKKKNN